MLFGKIFVWLAIMIKIACSFRLFRNSYNARSGLVKSFSTQLSMSDSSVRENRRSIVDQAGAAGLASAAVVAAAAVNSAVGMRQLSAPDSEQTFVFKDGAGQERLGKVDEYGLPLVYDKELIQSYWKKQGSALTQRWTEFLGYAVPYLTRIVTIIVAGGTDELKNNGASLAKDAREIFEKLGPTYVKMGQMMSVRPDVLPQEALDELKILQDSVEPFDTKTAVQQIESELGGELGQFFTEISEEPVAAASLAQVYKARLKETGEYVAVKVQRPRVLEVVSKDLYVLRRAAEVYQGLMDRFAPQQRTNYVALLNEWAVGFYTELDFLNEGANQKRMKDLLAKEGIEGMYIPTVYEKYSTRRILVSEWIDGKKLSDCGPEKIGELIGDAQEAFSTQLLQVGFFHSDPHPGNILLMDEPREKAQMALIDFGLVASIKQEDMDTMVSAIIHLANRDYPSLVDDFIQLGILPADCDRPKVVPLMDKALTPYVKGGGAQTYEAELRKIYGLDGTITGTAGGFQAMTQDALTVLNDIPFSIPPYFALLGRAIVTLEGVALTGNPNYGIIMESYPFVARKLLKEDRPEIQRALQEVLYSRSGDGLQATRLSVLLNSALGVVAESSNAFVDFDSIPDESVSLSTSIKFLLGPSASSLRNLLIEEAVTAGDILIRQAARKAYGQIVPRLPRPPLIGRFLPRPEDISVPFLIPTERFAEAVPSSATSSSSAAASLSQSEDVEVMDVGSELRDSFSTTGSTGSSSSGGIVDVDDASAGEFKPSSQQPQLSPDAILQQLTRNVQPVLLKPQEFLDTAAPKLSREEELYAISLTDLATQTLGEDAGVVVNGNGLLDPRAASRFLLSIASSGQLPLVSSILTPAQLKSINKQLQPLLNGNRSVQQQQSSQVLNSADGGAAVEDGMDDLVSGLSDLAPEESALLQETLNTIFMRISNKAVDRMQTLL
mmetsp:Transcript_29199/g.49133  ORF Transcript_29199/g.49133 Transcript_29199/m.49133 type:complete len:951 (-) Transcript_29199:412-3264(-)